MPGSAASMTLISSGTTSLPTQSPALTLIVYVYVTPSPAITAML